MRGYQEKHSKYRECCYCRFRSLPAPFPSVGVFRLPGASRKTPLQMEIFPYKCQCFF